MSHANRFAECLLHLNPLLPRVPGKCLLVFKAKPPAVFVADLTERVAEGQLIKLPCRIVLAFGSMALQKLTLRFVKLSTLL